MNDMLVNSALNDIGLIEDSQLGLIKEFPALDLTSSNTNKPKLHGSVVTAIAVKNRHSAVLTRGQTVLWNSDAEGPWEAVEGPTSGAAIAAGVIPWNIISSGVPVGSNFWLIIHGYCKVLSDGGDDVAALAPIQPAASGQVSAHSAGTNDIYCCGRMIEAIGDSAGALKAALVDFRF